MGAPGARSVYSPSQPPTCIEPSFRFREQSQAGNPMKPKIPLSQDTGQRTGKPRVFQAAVLGQEAGDQLPPAEAGF